MKNPACGARGRFCGFAVFLRGILRFPDFERGFFVVRLWCGAWQRWIADDRFWGSKKSALFLSIFLGEGPEAIQGAGAVTEGPGVADRLGDVEFCGGGG